MCDSYDKFGKSVAKTDTWHVYCIKLYDMLGGSSPETVMNDLSGVPIGDFENTVFSTTQLEHFITQCVSCYHGFIDA
jgi:hypothetical protein